MFKRRPYLLKAFCLVVLGVVGCFGGKEASQEEIVPSPRETLVVEQPAQPAAVTAPEAPPSGINQESVNRSAKLFNISPQTLQSGLQKFGVTSFGPGKVTIPQAQLWVTLYANLDPRIPLMMIEDKIAWNNLVTALNAGELIPAREAANTLIRLGTELDAIIAHNFSTLLVPNVRPISFSDSDKIDAKAVMSPFISKVNEPDPQSPNSLTNLLEMIPYTRGIVIEENGRETPVWVEMMAKPGADITVQLPSATTPFNLVAFEVSPAFIEAMQNRSATLNALVDAKPEEKFQRFFAESTVAALKRFNATATSIQIAPQTPPIIKSPFDAIQPQTSLDNLAPLPSSTPEQGAATPVIKLSPQPTLTPPTNIPFQPTLPPPPTSTTP